MNKLLKILINLTLITNSLISLSSTNHKNQNYSLIDNKLKNNDFDYLLLNTRLQNYFDQTIIQIHNLDDAKIKVETVIKDMISENFTSHQNDFKIRRLELKKQINNTKQWILDLDILNKDKLILSNSFEIRFQFLINLDDYLPGKKVYFEQFYHKNSNTERILLIREINKKYDVDILTFDDQLQDPILSSIYLGSFEKNSSTGSFALEYNSNSIELFYYYDQFLQAIKINNDFSYYNYYNSLSSETSNVRNYYNNQSQLHINFTDRGYHAYVSDVSEKYNQINSKYIYGIFFQSPLTAGNTIINLPETELLTNKYLLFSGNYILLIGFNNEHKRVGYIYNYVNEQPIIKLDLEVLKNKKIIEVINWNFESKNTLSYISKLNNKLYLEVINLNDMEIIYSTTITDDYLIYRNSSNYFVFQFTHSDHLRTIKRQVMDKNHNILDIDFINRNLLPRILCDYAFFTE